MSEIICSFSVIGHPSKSGYFLVEPKVSFLQFTNFINEKIFSESFNILDRTGKSINNDSQLRIAIRNRSVSGDVLNISLVPIINERKKVFLRDVLHAASLRSSRNFVEPRISAAFPVVHEKLPNNGNYHQKMLSEIRYVASKRDGIEFKEPVVCRAFPIVNDRTSFRSKMFQELFKVASERSVEFKEPIISHSFPIVHDKESQFRCLMNDILVKVSEREQLEFKEPVVKHSHIATCDYCGDHIIGIRYKCLHCPDYDLCEKCEEDNHHNQFHVFAKIIRPVHCSIHEYSKSTKFQCVDDTLSRLAALEANVSHLHGLLQMLSEH